MPSTRLRSTTVPHPDIYQTLACCTAFRLPRGHLVCAEGNEEPRTYRISSAGVKVVAHCLDLEASRDELLSQIADLGGCDRVEPWAGGPTGALRNQLLLDREVQS